MSTERERTILRGLLGNHTYACALPLRGGVCNCQFDYDPSTDPWPYLVRFGAGHRGIPVEDGTGVVGKVTLIPQDSYGAVDR